MNSKNHAKIWEETKFQLPEYPQSGSKAMSIEEIKRERVKVSDNNGPHIRLNQLEKQP